MYTGEGMDLEVFFMSRLHYGGRGNRMCAPFRLSLASKSHGEVRGRGTREIRLLLRSLLLNCEARRGGRRRRRKKRQGFSIASCCSCDATKEEDNKIREWKANDRKRL